MKHLSTSILQHLFFILCIWYSMYTTIRTVNPRNDNLFFSVHAAHFFFSYFQIPCCSRDILFFKQQALYVKYFIKKEQSVTRDSRYLMRACLSRRQLQYPQFINCTAPSTGTAKIVSFFTSKNRYSHRTWKRSTFFNLHTQYNMNIY